MALLTPQQNQHLAGSLLEGLPEEATKYIPDAVSKVKKEEHKTTLRDTLLFSAGGTAVFNAAPVWRDRFGKTSKVKPLTKAKNLLLHSKFAGRLLTGAAAGALATAPIEYIQAKASETFEKDKEFHGGHFASILAPAVVSATAGTGSFTNTMSQLANSGKQGTVSTVKNILSPTKILASTKTEMGNVRGLLKGGRGSLGKGLLSLALMGTSLIDPIMYAARTRNKKGDGSMKKTAGLLTKEAKFSKFERNIAAKLVVAGGTTYAASKLYDKRKKQIRLSYRTIKPSALSVKDYALMRSI